MIVLNMSHEKGEKKRVKRRNEGGQWTGVQVYYVIMEVTGGIVCLR